MASCSRCGRRVAKRACPALGSGLCQLCCGTLREKEVHCPPSCPHLAAHQPYHEKRILERRPPYSAAGRVSRADILDDERLARLALEVERVLVEVAAARPEFSDMDAILAVEYAREKTVKGAPRLILPGAALKPANEAGEAVLQAVEAFRFQPSGLLSTGLEAYKSEEKAAVLERVGQGIRLAVAGRPGGRAYLEAVEERFRRAGREPRDRKLLTLT